MAILNEEDELTQGEYIAAYIRQKVREQEFQFGDVAILMRSRTHLPELEEALRSKGVPFRTLGGVGFYQRQEIYDVYHLLRFLINPNDDTALVGLLRSPFANISDEGLFFLSQSDTEVSYWQRIQTDSDLRTLPSDDMKRVKRFRRLAHQWLLRRDRIGFSDLLNEIFNNSMYRTAMAAEMNGGQLQANLDKILHLSESFESNGLVSLQDFADSLQQLINQEAKEGEGQTETDDSDNVKIMTIHASKGLQFPVVIVPWLESQKKISSGMVFDETFGPLVKVQPQALPEGSPADDYYLLQRARWFERNKELAEMRRLFYVACTRARDGLLLCAQVKKSKIPPDSGLEWIVDSLGLDPEDLPDGTIRIGGAVPVTISGKIEDSGENNFARHSNVYKNLEVMRKAVSAEIDDSERKPVFLHPLSDQPRGEIFSATQIMIFRENREEYFRRYHLGFFENDYEHISSLTGGEDIALLKGKVLHRYLEHYPGADIQTILFEMEVFDRSLSEKLVAEIGHINKLLKNSDTLKQIIHAVEARNELSVTARLDRDFITGTLDRLFKNKDGLWEVVDYKTNRITTARVEETAEKYGTQMEVYAFLAGGLFPHQPEIPVSLYFTQADEKFSRNFSRGEINRIKNSLQETVSEIRTMYPFMATD